MASTKAEGIEEGDEGYGNEGQGGGSSSSNDGNEEVSQNVLLGLPPSDQGGRQLSFCANGVKVHAPLRCCIAAVGAVLVRYIYIYIYVYALQHSSILFCLQCYRSNA